VTHLGEVLPVTALGSAPPSPPVFGEPRGARAAARHGFLGQITGVSRAEILGRARLHGRG